MDPSSFDWQAFSRSGALNSPSSASTLSPNVPITSALQNLSINSKPVSSASGVPTEASNALEPPLLTVNDLSPEESKTYLRWYNDLSLRKQPAPAIADVFEFFRNFNLSSSLVSYLQGIFGSAPLSVGRFCALARLIGHHLKDLVALPGRSLVYVACSVPKPRSILAHKENEDKPQETSNNAIDLDSFARFMMTGEKPGRSSQSPIKKKKKKKRVQFSDQLVTVVAAAIEEPEPQPEPQLSNNLDLSLPMDQLLQKLKNTDQKHQIAVRNISEEEVKAEQDVLGKNFKHFQNVNIESALVHGKAAAIPQELVATNTGGGQIQQYRGGQYYSQQASQLLPQQNAPVVQQPLQPTLTGSANYLLRKNTNNSNSNNNNVYYDQSQSQGYGSLQLGSQNTGFTSNGMSTGLQNQVQNTGIQSIGLQNQSGGFTNSSQGQNSITQNTISQNPVPHNTNHLNGYAQHNVSQTSIPQTTGYSQNTYQNGLLTTGFPQNLNLNGSQNFGQSFGQNTGQTLGQTLGQNLGGFSNIASLNPSPNNLSPNNTSGVLNRLNNTSYNISPYLLPNDSGVANPANSQYQPSMLSPLASNNLRTNSVSPQPTRGDQFIESLGGSSSSLERTRSSSLSNGVYGGPALPPKINLSSADLSYTQGQYNQNMYPGQMSSNFGQNQQFQAHVQYPLQQVQQVQPLQLTGYMQYGGYQQQQQQQQPQDDLEWFERD